MLKVEYVSIDDLIPYANNAKVHTAEQIEQIKRSIEEFGFNDPIAIWKNNEIIEGHGRLIAAKEMGMEEVPVLRLDELSDEQRRAYMLVHNQLTINTGFNLELLDLELDNIEMDMQQFGLSTAEIDWSTVEDLTEETYDEPQHNMLVCPKCHHVDRDIHFKKMKGVEADD